MHHPHVTNLFCQSFDSPGNADEITRFHKMRETKPEFEMSVKGCFHIGPQEIFYKSHLKTIGGIRALQPH